MVCERCDSHIDNCIHCSPEKEKHTGLNTCLECKLGYKVKEVE